MAAIPLRAQLALQQEELREAREQLAVMERRVAAAHEVRAGGRACPACCLPACLLGCLAALPWLGLRFQG